MTVGDSLTHGFQSGAIFNTHVSYLAIVARTPGFPASGFVHPSYEAPGGGFPLSVEFLLREIEAEFDSSLNLFERVKALGVIQRFLYRAEDHWESGPGAATPDLGSIPHVTIAPLARGVGNKMRPDSRYFSHYTYVWITDEQFDPDNDPHTTAEETRAVDSAIDPVQRNDRGGRARGAPGRPRLAAPRSCRHPRSPGRAPVRRDATGGPAGLVGPVPATGAVTAPRSAAHHALLPLRAWWTHRGRPVFLGGVHPTTIGYGIIAQELLNLMVPANAPRVDFERLIREDSLISRPPHSVESNLVLLGRIWDTLDTLLKSLGKLIAGCRSCH